MVTDLAAILHQNQHGHGFGTAPVFLASISTILGAILFLRFGYAVGHIGLLQSLGVIALGHLVTIPTVLAVSEIATNRRVAGGGAYYIVSRSFGTSIGGTIGFALFLSQAISIAFYMVALAAAFEPVFDFIRTKYELENPINIRFLSIPCTIILILLMLTKGANMGVSMLWVICGILAASLAAFFLGSALPVGEIANGIDAADLPEKLTNGAEKLANGDVPVEQLSKSLDFNARIEDGDSFGRVFAICFPAFTGMIAGLGLSGDLRNPQRSIPLGTIAATVAGMVVYVLVAFKLAQSATPEQLAGDKFIMAHISIWDKAIYIGLGAASLSSALGSIMIAPRTLQALSRDNVLPIPALNRLMGTGVGKTQEPITCDVRIGCNCNGVCRYR